MHSAWQTFLHHHHAAIENDRVVHFGDIVAERIATCHGTIIADLSTFGLIQFSGDDARSFLQNQLTCDLREIDVYTARYGAYCSPKGRILANFMLWQHGDSFFMQLPLSLLVAIQKRLSMFVLRAKVQLTNISEEWVQIGLSGSDAVSALENTGVTRIPDQPLHIVVHDNTRIICLSSDRYVLITPIESAVALWNSLNRHTRPVGTSCWEWLTIQTGIPVILPQTQEEFIPQMVNLDTLGGVSFKKGCYPGQEIVARTQYLGKLKRRMFVAHIDNNETIAPGDLLYSEDMMEQASGMIVNATPDPAGGTVALAVIQQSSQKAYAIHWRSLQGPVLAFNSDRIKND